MKFLLEIKLGNAEMLTGGDVARALKDLARDLRSYDPDYPAEVVVRYFPGVIYDANGNRVGSYKIEK